MLRDQFLKKENGYSIPSRPWGQYPWSRYSVHTLTEEEVLKPYLITYNAYGDLEAWDIILLINGIGNTLDLEAGTKIRLPDLDHLLEWLNA